MAEIEARLIDERSLNKMIDMVNAGRRLVAYAKHYEYCPCAPSRSTLTSEIARAQVGTCNCGLADAVVEAFRK